MQKKEALFMQVKEEKEELPTDPVSPASCARSPTRSDSASGLTVIENEEQRKRNNLVAELNLKQADLKKIKQEIREEEGGSAAASSKQRIALRGGFQKRLALRGKGDRQQQPLWFMCLVAGF